VSFAPCVTLDHHVRREENLAVSNLPGSAAGIHHTLEYTPTALTSKSPDSRWAVNLEPGFGITINVSA